MGSMNKNLARMAGVVSGAALLVTGLGVASAEAAGPKRCPKPGWVNPITGHVADGTCSEPTRPTSSRASVRTVTLKFASGGVHQVRLATR